MSNYQAMIAKVNQVLELKGADKIQVGKVLGETVIIGKEIQVGTVGVFFCSGTQLSEQYCKQNNLFRSKEDNLDQLKSGFFESSRRVRVQPFMKVKSEGYFAPLESLGYTGHDLKKLKVGDTFESLGDNPICKKYVNPNVKDPSKKNSKKKKLDVPMFVEHCNTSQYRHNKSFIFKGDLISIQSKKHGTSMRVGNHKVNINLNKIKVLINKILPIFPTSRWDLVVGTRRVVLNNSDSEGFHGKEAYRFEIANQLSSHITKGMTVYGEIVGYVNGKSVMSTHNTKDLKDKKYTAKYSDQMSYKYGCLEDTYDYHIYRITMASEGGDIVDFTQPQLVSWCKDRDIKPSYDLVEPFIYDGDIDTLDTLVDYLTERPELLTEDYHDPSHISEGIVVRIDNHRLSPTFLKSKSYAFKLLEGIVSETVVEIEDES